jgi:hypothetical protein
MEYDFAGADVIFPAFFVEAAQGKFTDMSFIFADGKHLAARGKDQKVDAIVLKVADSIPRGSSAVVDLRPVFRELRVLNQTRSARISSPQLSLTKVAQSLAETADTIIQMVRSNAFAAPPPNMGRWGGGYSR